MPPIRPEAGGVLSFCPNRLTWPNPPWHSLLFLPKINTEKLRALQSLQVTRSQSPQPRPGEREIQLRWVGGWHCPASQLPHASFFNLIWPRHACCQPFPLFVIAVSSLLKRKTRCYHWEHDCVSLPPSAECQGTGREAWAGKGNGARSLHARWSSSL